MPVLQTVHLFSFPKPLNPTTKPFPFHQPRCPLFLRNQIRFANLTVKSFGSQEFPVDETFLQKYAPKDKLTEDEARKIDWVERGWAPWEEILTPEGDFAKTSLNEGEEVPLQTPEAIEAFKMLSPAYRKKKMEEMGLTEDDYYARKFEIKDKPPPLETKWTGPMVIRLVPPRDWPPRGWEVDRKELAFIREAHKIQDVRVTTEELEGASKADDDVSFERYKVFLKQYNEWVAANKDKLEDESYKYDQDYHAGRRKRGKDYKEGMVDT